MLSVAEALRAVIAKVPRLGTERVPLAAARGRVLAADIVATRPLPGFDNSAMDGYAARSSDLPASLPLVGVAAAGAPAGTFPPGAVRIFTGAPMPAGLDTVVLQEDAEIDGDKIALPASKPDDNIRRTGEDIATGDRVLSIGTRLGAWDIGVLAALGCAEVLVSKRPRVAILATGDELVDVATVPAAGQLVASSTYALCSLIEDALGTTTPLGIVRDDITAIRTAIDAADHDVLITTGGVSVGDRDHVKAAFAAAGIELEVSKIALKPGKPFSFGRRAELSVFGLPGNPVSTLVAYELFVRPALLAMQGASVLHRPRAPVALPRGYKKPAGRAHYLRARIAREGERLVAHPHPKQGSAMQSSLLGCSALVEIAAELSEVPPGALAPAILLEAI